MKKSTACLLICIGSIIALYFFCYGVVRRRWHRWRLNLGRY